MLGKFVDIFLAYFLLSLSHSDLFMQCNIHFCDNSDLQGYIIYIFGVNYTRHHNLGVHMADSNVVQQFIASFICKAIINP